jgi:hypothetical protein
MYMCVCIYICIYTHTHTHTHTHTFVYVCIYSAPANASVSSSSAVPLQRLRQPPRGTGPSRTGDSVADSPRFVAECLGCQQMEELRRQVEEAAVVRRGLEEQLSAQVWCVCVCVCVCVCRYGYACVVKRLSARAWNVCMCVCPYGMCVHMYAAYTYV